MTRPSQTYFLPFFLLVFSLTSIGCDSGGGTDGDETLSKDEAQTAIQSVDAELSNDADAGLNSGAFAVTMRGLFNGADQTGTNGQTERPIGVLLIDELDTVFDTANDRLNFSSSTGVYDWDRSQQAWTRTGPSENVVLNFPSSRSAPGNDATFTLSAYQDQEVTVEGESVYLPQTLRASLTVNGRGEVFAVDLSDSAFYPEQIDGTQVPRRFLLSILTAPYQHTVGLSSPSKREFEFRFELDQADEDRFVLGVLINALLKQDVDQVSTAEDVDELAGILRLGPNLAIVYTIQVDELAGLDDPTAQQVNDRVDATVQYQGQTLGTLQLDDELGPVLVYNDGSKEPLIDLFDNTLSNVGGSPLNAVVNAGQKALSTVF